jgi:HEAT repeat protein
VKSLLASLVVAAAFAAPASAHLLARGIPLSELAATSPVAVIGHVESTANEAGVRSVALVVEESVLGSVPPGPLRFALEGHHTPDYAARSRVLVFMKGPAAPWVSRQTALDVVQVPERAAARRALVEAVRAYAGLRRAPDAGERVAQLKAQSLGNLASASERVRHEALLDLLAIAAAAPFRSGEVERIAALARAPETPETLAPGLVVLLAALRAPEADPALLAVLRSAANPQVRAMAARVVGKRGAAQAEPALRDALRDPALGVRLTAQRALEEIATAKRRS